MKRKMLYIVLVLLWSLYAFKGVDTVDFLNRYPELGFFRLHPGTLTMGKGLFDEKLSYSSEIHKNGFEISRKPKFSKIVNLAFDISIDKHVQRFFFPVAPSFFGQNGFRPA